MTQGLHDAAVRHLTGLLAIRRMPVPAGFEPPDGDASRSIDTLVAIGALSDADAEEWRARFARASEPMTEPHPDLRRRALAHLEELGRAGGDVVTAASALVAGRAIAPQDAERHAAAVRPAPIGDPSGDDDFLDWPALDDSVLRRALLAPETRVAGLRATVVELYEGGTVVHWHVDARASGADLALDPEFELADGLGTSYTEGENAVFAAADQGHSTGYVEFTPAVPNGATRLDFGAAGGTPIGIPL